MANNFMVTEKCWEELSQSDQNRIIYDSVNDIANRLSVIEGRKRMDRAASFCGGIFGGFLAAIGVKYTGAM